MDASITIKNFRCFPDSNPAQFSMKDGFTALIGRNNSGKSSLLKFFFEFRDLFVRLARPGDLNVSLDHEVPFTSPRTVGDVSELFCNGNSRDLEITVCVPRAHGGISIAAIRVKVARNTTNFVTQLFLEDMSRFPASGITTTANGVAAVSRDGTTASLNSLVDVLAELADTLYIGAFRNTLNLGSRQDYYDIVIGQSFISAWKAFKTGLVPHQNEAAHKVEKQIAHIFDFTGFQVNAGPDDQTLQLFINDRSFKIGELGSGMAQFILVLANAAMRRPKYILIDEPELNLHASLQIDFLTTLASYANRGVVYATHSLGLARAMATDIYSLQKKGEFEVHVRPFQATVRLSEFLGEMSFGGYKELGFDIVLLVEGKTDVAAIQQLLRLLGKDHKVVLLPLGGSALLNGAHDTETQLLELTRISANISAIIDSERDDHGEPLSADREAFRSLCAKVGVKCHVLERRAIENYWTRQAVEATKGPGIKALAPYQKLAGWRKNENWMIARHITKQELLQTDLGNILINV